MARHCELKVRGEYIYTSGHVPPVSFAMEINLRYDALVCIDDVIHSYRKTQDGLWLPCIGGPANRCYPYTLYRFR